MNQGTISSTDQEYARLIIEAIQKMRELKKFSSVETVKVSITCNSDHPDTQNISTIIQQLKEDIEKQTSSILVKTPKNTSFSEEFILAHGSMPTQEFTHGLPGYNTSSKQELKVTIRMSK